MAHLIDIPAFKDERGELRVIQKELPFQVKRIYYITGKPNVVRGGHRHKNSDQVLICTVLVRFRAMMEKALRVLCSITPARRFM